MYLLSGYSVALSLSTHRLYPLAIASFERESRSVSMICTAYTSIYEMRSGVSENFLTRWEVAAPRLVGSSSGVSNT